MISEQVFEVRNEYYPEKAFKTKLGPTKIKVSRDCNGDFEPRIVHKHQTTANELENQIIAMYARGMSRRDSEDHMQDIYGVDVSPTLVSKITDRILPQITEWQSWPLARIYRSLHRVGC